MATSKRSRTARTRRARSKGGTVLGFMLGLIVGLTIAVVVALVVTRAPVPFVNRAARMAEQRIVPPKSPAEAPDPNASLTARNRAATLPPPVASAPPTAAAPAVPPQMTAPGAPMPANGGADARASYLLQAGAFRSQAEADGMRAKLALIGYEARVVTADVSGQPLYRVRVGPYAGLDEMNRVRAKLAESGIEASIVRQR